MNKNILFAILIFIIAQTMVWLQINGQFIWESFKKYEWVLLLFGIPISYLFLEATLALCILPHNYTHYILVGMSCSK